MVLFLSVITPGFAASRAPRPVCAAREVCRAGRYLWDRGFLPGSVGGLQAPTNWILSSFTQV